MRNNTNPQRRRQARAAIGISSETLARWPLFDVISKAMKPSGKYAKGTLSAYRKAVRVYQQFIGHEQSPVNVTEKKFDQFRQWLSDAGYGPAHREVLQECLAAVVRFADGALLPARGYASRPIWADAETPGTIEHYMVNEFFPVNAAIASDKTRYHYGVVAALLTKFLDRAAVPSDLTESTFRNFVAAQQCAGKRPKTIRSYAWQLRNFWAWAAGRNLVDVEPPDDLIPSDTSAKIKQKLDPCGPGSLSRFVDRYFSTRDTSPDYETRVRKRMAKLVRFVGSVSIEEVFSLDVVNRFLRGYEDRSPYTIKCIRSDVVSLWHAAADEDLVGEPPLRKLYKPKLPELVIECYTHSEVMQLLAAARTLTGEYPTGVSYSAYWAAAISVAWDSALRRGDVWKFRKSLVRPDGTLRVIQSKTKQAVTVRLRDSTRKALDAIPFDRALEWGMAWTYFGRHFKRIVEKSGVDKGTFRWIRRSAATYCELELIGAGTKVLGHRTPGVFEKHYDGKLADHKLPIPPALVPDVNVSAPTPIDVEALAFL